MKQHRVIVPAILTVATFAVKPIERAGMFRRSGAVNRLKFWKRAKSAEDVSDSPVIKRFKMEPRRDTGTAGLPADPEQAR